METTGTPTEVSAQGSATYRVSARATAPGAALATVKGRAIEFDTSRGGSDEVPGPAEFLCLSLAACLLKNVERLSHLLSFDYAGAEVTVWADRQESPPRFSRFTYELAIDTAEDDRRVELLHRNLRRFGTVYNTLAGSCEVTGTIVVGPDVTARFERPPSDPLRAHTCC